MTCPPFRPHPLVRGGNLQTIIAALSSRNQTMDAQEVLRVPLEGKDQLVVEINLPERAMANTPMVLLFPGPGESGDVGYVIRLAAKLVTRGFRVGRVNHRGCYDKEDQATRHMFHAGRAADIEAAITACAGRFPGAPLLLIGYSMAGSMILRLLGSRPDLGTRLPALQRAAVVCPPLDFEVCSKAIGRRGSRYLDRYYVRHMSRLAGTEGTTTARQFDARYSAPEAGFADRQSFYRGVSPGPVVDRIRLPVLVLAAADDPANPIGSVLRAPFSDQVTLQVEHSGGHLGFLSRHKTRFGDYRWLDEFLVDWVEENPPAPPEAGTALRG